MARCYSHFAIFWKKEIESLMDGKTLKRWHRMGENKDAGWNGDTGKKLSWQKKRKCETNPMPRQTRLDAPSVLHHIMIRGIDRLKIFINGRDRDEYAWGTGWNPNGLLHWCIHSEFCPDSGSFHIIKLCLLGLTEQASPLPARKMSFWRNLSGILFKFRGKIKKFEF